MAKYSVNYYECYSGNYEVEANSKEEAEEIVRNNIATGKFKGPDDCDCSGYETVLLD